MVRTILNSRFLYEISADFSLIRFILLSTNPFLSLLLTIAWKALSHGS